MGRPGLSNRFREDGALCIAENSITQEVLAMTHQAVVGTPFHAVSAEHMADEGRHAGFFQRLLRHYWLGLDETTRETLGGALPVFLERFLLDPEAIVLHLRAVLREAGLDAEGVARVMGDFAAVPVRCADFPMIRNVLGLLERSGVLDHPPTREALARHGWVA